MELILKYFPDLNPWQISCFEAMQPLYKEWNSAINVISRKDIDHLYEHHILHSLGIARVMRLPRAPQCLMLAQAEDFREFRWR